MPMSIQFGAAHKNNPLQGVWWKRDRTVCIHLRVAAKMSQIDDESKHENLQTDLLLRG